MNILFIGSQFDKPYLHSLKVATRGHAVRVNLTYMETLTEVAMLCKRDGCKHVITTQSGLIPKLCSTASEKDQTVENYAGSYIYNAKHDLWFLIVPNLRQTITLSYGQFLLERYVGKITVPNKWLKTDKFSWGLVEGSMYEQLFTILTYDNLLLVSVDIETRKDLSISSISYTCVHRDLSTETYVVPLPYGLDVEDYEFRFAWIAKYNASSAPKLLQNGKYDIAYLNRYSCPLVNYFYDTAVAHHSWYCELKKDLGRLAAFYIRDSLFWKNEGDTGNAMDLYEYNARDTWYTAWAFLAWMFEAPRWAKENYKQQFPVIAPAILAEATGMAVDFPMFEKIKTKQEAIRDAARESLAINLATPNFNPASPKQVKTLLRIIGCKDITSTEEKELKKAAFRHPYNTWIIDKIFEYRKAAKLVSTYLVEDKFFFGRLLTSLTPYGTKTGRLASESHAFWCGQNMQNIPRQGGIKAFLKADPGFLIGEADYAQAESRDTGYITGDAKLIEAVDGENDFHSFNASAFFGIPYNEICINNPDGSHTILDKEIRQLSKPVNHGKNYNMGDSVLVDTMGLTNIFKAAKRLGLPKHFAALQVAAFLGKCFESTYRVVSKVYPAWIIKTVNANRLLVGATGWTRYCFGDPAKNKRDLNAYIAHPPQSLNAMTLNKAFVKVFYTVWWNNYQNFKLVAQIHDSILFQYREGYEYFAQEVKQCMEFEVPVTDIGGVTRILLVPVDLSLGGQNWQDSKEH